jgi:hypothetical protein
VPHTPDELDDRLRRWIAAHRRVFALTGAGCSTASGIPDYRDDRGGWKRRPPVMIQAFRGDAAVYRRYWARAFAGWARFVAAEPSAAHRAFAAWEAAGTLLHLVTQNVDGLHQRAGSRAVVDLHGRLDAVVCLGCGDRTSRAALQATIAAENSGWRAEAAIAPDGDADPTRWRQSRRSRRRAAPAAAACSSPTSSSSARTFRASATRQRATRSRPPTRFLSPARR